MTTNLQLRTRSSSPWTPLDQLDAISKEAMIVSRRRRDIKRITSDKDTPTALLLLLLLLLAVIAVQF